MFNISVFWLSPSAVYEALLQDQTRHIRSHSEGVLETWDDTAGLVVCCQQTQMMTWIFTAKFGEKNAAEKLTVAKLVFLYQLVTEKNKNKSKSTSRRG